MLENCLSGSEGGGAFALPTPIFTRRREARQSSRGTLGLRSTRRRFPRKTLLPDDFFLWSDWQRRSARFFDGTERNGGHSAFDPGKFADSGKQSTKGCW
jgi:hypothetical protein